MVRSVLTHPIIHWVSQRRQRTESYNPNTREEDDKSRTSQKSSHKFGRMIRLLRQSGENFYRANAATFCKVAAVPSS